MPYRVYGHRRIRRRQPEQRDAAAGSETRESGGETFGKVPARRRQGVVAPAGDQERVRLPEVAVVRSVAVPAEVVRVDAVGTGRLKKGAGRDEAGLGRPIVDVDGPLKLALTLLRPPQLHYGRVYRAERLDTGDAQIDVARVSEDVVRARQAHGGVQAAAVVSGKLHDGLVAPLERREVALAIVAGQARIVDLDAVGARERVDLPNEARVVRRVLRIHNGRLHAHLAAEKVDLALGDGDGGMVEARGAEGRGKDLELARVPAVELRMRIGLAQDAVRRAADHDHVPFRRTSDGVEDAAAALEAQILALEIRVDPAAALAGRLRLHQNSLVKKLAGVDAREAAFVRAGDDERRAII